jgi:SAM-dependent methyltransferase
MTDWAAGYVADVGYTFGYYTELNPGRLRLAFLNAGLACPKAATACELGFGQGLSVNIHAAGSTTQWWGTDFNPSQAGFAQNLTKVSGADTRLFDASFAEFCSRGDLPDFDFIALHGIWSWISDANREVIVDFVRRKLKVGGVLYLSYNAQPGRAAMMPMRDLLMQYCDAMTPPALGTLGRIDAAMSFADKLLATNPAYISANPQVTTRLEKMKGQPRNYLAHEYFNRDWHPMRFSRVAEWLAPAKLSYACSASYLEHIDNLNLTPEQQAVLREIPDPTFREDVRDFMVNQQFRRDYWVKGPQRLSPSEQYAELVRQQVVLIQPRAGVSLKIDCALGAASMPERTYNPLLDVLADHRPRSLDQIAAAVKEKNIPFKTVLQAVIVLLGTGALQTVQEIANEAAAEQIKLRTIKFNAFLCERARAHGDIHSLVSPLTGGGIAANRFHQLFLLARADGQVQPAECAAYVWRILAATGEKLLRDGQVLESEAENMDELKGQASAFLTGQLPILQALGIA